MKINSAKEIRKKGFVGFKPIDDLLHDCTCIPAERGLYLVINPFIVRPVFQAIGTGGYYKRKNPNVDINTLESKWVAGAVVIYIGQAGGIIAGRWSKETLNNRIKKLLQFGQGKAVAHYGGRYIWQVSEFRQLILCWKPLPGKIVDPKKVESEMITSFTKHYGKRPFANLIG